MEFAYTTEIPTREPFTKIFPPQKNIIRDIEAGIKRLGFDSALPLVIGRIGEDKEEVLVDGHTRLAAAKLANLLKLPVTYRDFEDDEKALDYAIEVQKCRRNLTDAELITVLETLDSRKKAGRPAKSGDDKLPPDGGNNQSDLPPSGGNNRNKTSAQETAEKLGTSTRKVERARRIIDEADPETKQQVIDGEISINKAEQRVRQQKRATPPGFNSQDTDSIEWAKWSWNPVTGCKHDCEYCYARDIANRFYEEGFEPTLREDRLNAPWDTKIPEKRREDPGIFNVFVCSMADLFGEWVPDEWIEKVLDVCRRSYEEGLPWNYIFLTKNPARLPRHNFPPNCAVGATVDVDARLQPSIQGLKDCDAQIRFLSCEPLLEPIFFDSLEPDAGNWLSWVIFGAQSRTSSVPAFQPEWGWVEMMMRPLRVAGIPIYFKPNLQVRPREYPNALRFPQCNSR